MFGIFTNYCWNILILPQLNKYKDALYKDLRIFTWSILVTERERDYILHMAGNDTSEATDNLNTVHFRRQIREMYLVIYKRHTRYICSCSLLHKLRYLVIYKKHTRIRYVDVYEMGTTNERASHLQFKYKTYDILTFMISVQEIR